MLVLLLLLFSFAATGCVRRTMKITTSPPDALVFVNDQEVGRSDVSTDFLWYGDYDIVIRKDGFETLQTNWQINEPWFQFIPLDFFFEVIWPGELHDVRTAHYELQAKQEISREALLEHAAALRGEAMRPTERESQSASDKQESGN